MEFTDIKKWLDWHVNNLKSRDNMMQFSNHIRMASYPNCIQLYEGIETVADIMCLELMEDGKVEEYYRYHFLYENVEFSQLSEERLGKYAGND